MPLDVSSTSESAFQAKHTFYNYTKGILEVNNLISEAWLTLRIDVGPFDSQMMTHAGRVDPAGSLMTFGTEAHNCPTMSIYHEYREVMYQHHRFGMDIDLKHRLKIIPTIIACDMYETQSRQRRELSVFS